MAFSEFKVCNFNTRACVLVAFSYLKSTTISFNHEENVSLTSAMEFCFLKLLMKGEATDILFLLLVLTNPMIRPNPLMWKTSQPVCSTTLKT